MTIGKDFEIVLRDHEKRISQLESRFLRGANKPRRVATSERISLPDRIIDLRDKSFFSQPKTAEDVHKKLQDTYHCELNRVSMALLRLAKRKQLRRATKKVQGRLHQAYAW